MRREVGKQPELGARQAHRPRAGRSLGRRHVLAQLSRVLDEEPMSGRSSSTWSVSVRTVRAARRLAECEMGARELEPDLDGHPWKAVVEHGTQAMGACQRGAASCSLASWSATRAVATCTSALDE